MRPIEFERTLCRAMAKAVGPAPGDVVVAAVSGGADSTAMLLALAERVRRDKLGWRLHVAHFDHGLRGAESSEDALFVERLAERLGLTVTVERAVGARDREESLRDLRYSFLERVARIEDSSIVATAHQADDQAETVLHHAVRGSGLRGIAGIRTSRAIRKGSRIRLVRPMLEVGRADVLAYLTSRGEAYRHDGSNDSDRYARNRVRRRVLPVIEAQLNGRARGALVRLSRQASAAMELIGIAVRRAWKTAVVSREQGAVVLSASALREEAAIVRAEIVRRALRACGAGLKLVRQEHLTAAADLCVRGRGRSRVQMPGGYAAIRRGEWLLVGKSDAVASACGTTDRCVRT